MWLSVVKCLSEFHITIRLFFFVDQLLIMAEKPEINLTLYESAKTIRATEKEFQVKWALDYLNGVISMFFLILEHAQNGRLSITLFEMYYLNLLNSVVYAEAANDTWKLEKNQFVNTTNSYLHKNNSIVRDSCTSLLNESNARNWNETIQKTVNYGCTVLNKYTEWKWKNRTELDLLASFDYKVAKEKYSHAQRMKKICLDNAWDKCLLAVKANLEYEQVKENLITQVKFFNTQMFNYFKFLEPIERVNTVVELMESEVEYNIGRSSYRENNCRSMSVQL
ncbi:secretory glycoprotein k5 precursor [Schistosoma japonicum]|nr:secretory glycoprotein k5 precursor [Schistosoma japonicum]